MRIAAFILSYLAVGLFAARQMYRWRIKAGYHDRSYSYDEEENTVIFSVLALFAWPGLMVIPIWLATRWFVTSNPPLSPKERDREEQKLRSRIASLEDELGIGKD